MKPRTITVYGYVCAAYVCVAGTNEWFISMLESELVLRPAMALQFLSVVPT